MGKDSSALVTDNDKLFTLAYEELRRLASNVARTRPGQTLSPTALVNEAWIKMSSSQGMGFGDVLHFKRVAANAMRQILVDHARRKMALKRGGCDSREFVTFSEEVCQDASSPVGLIALNQAIEELARKSPRQAEIAVLRIFQEMEIRDIATTLQVSEITVHRDWKLTRAWLSIQLLPEARGGQAIR